MTTNPYHARLIADEAAAWSYLLCLEEDPSAPLSVVEAQRKVWAACVEACDDNDLEVEDV